MSEPITHYDKNDSHGYKMTAVLEPGDTDSNGDHYSQETEFNEAQEKLAEKEAPDESNC